MSEKYYPGMSALYDENPADLPRFHRFRLNNSNYISLLFGTGVFNPRNYITNSETVIEQRIHILELQIPSSFDDLRYRAARIAVYKDENHSELLDIIIIGCRGNRSPVRSEIAKIRQPSSSENTLNIDGNSLSFRIKQEADLWRVAIDDVLGADQGRWKELVETDSPNPPRGYRGHLSRLEQELSCVPEQDKSLLRNCLTSIDYMKKRLNACRCSTSVDLQTEDVLYETRAVLIKKLNCE